MCRHAGDESFNFANNASYCVGINEYKILLGTSKNESWISSCIRWKRFSMFEFRYQRVKNHHNASRARGIHVEHKSEYVNLIDEGTYKCEFISAYWNQLYLIHS